MQKLEQEREEERISLARSFIEKLEDIDNLLPYEEALQIIERIGTIFGQKESLERYSPWPGSVKASGFYSLVTREFMDELLREMFRRRLSDFPAIEVCAGRGALSYHLQNAGIDIVAIDDGSDRNTTGRSFSKRQDMLSHREALEKYQPKVVIGNWIPDVPEIGRDILEFPNVDYFIDIGELSSGATWLTDDYNPENFKLMYLHNISRYTIGVSDYFYTQKGKLKRTQLTQARLWKRKGAPTSIDHRFDEGLMPS